MKTPLALYLLPIFLLSGCTAFQKKENITPEVVGTDYDFSRPHTVAPKGKPVWVPPEIVKGWVAARIDPKTNEWVGGHYKAAIVREGYWATQEEAALLNIPFQSAANSNPIVSAPRNQQRPSGLTTTELEQRLASLENTTRNLNAPSRTSISNQTASASSLPVVTLPEPRTVPPVEIPKPESSQVSRNNSAPNLSLLTSETKVKSESTVPSPKLIEIVEPVPPKVETTPLPIPPVSVPSPSPVSTPATDNLKDDSPLPPPTLMPVQKPKPSAVFNKETNEIIVSQGDAGKKIGIETPSGNVIVTYKDGNRADVSFGGRTETITINSPDENIKIQLD